MKAFLLPFCILLVGCSLFFGSCCKPRILKSRNIVFDTLSNLKLDVYAPDDSRELKPVLVFIHGGNWVSGNKNTYRFFGKGMAHKGIVTVIINYRLSALTNYEGMAHDVAMAIQRVKQSCAQYGGDSSRIYVSGHSAGGHLAALIATDNHYFEALKMKNPLKGAILVDAFGLDMYTYLSHSHDKKDALYYPTFSRDPEAWKLGSPINHLHKGMPPFLVFLGGKTYPAIKAGTAEFMQALQPFAPETKIVHFPERGHIAMIFQFFNENNKAYGEMMHFMKMNTK
jgi:acetyl esterase/lipase